MNLKVVDTRI